MRHSGHIPPLTGLWREAPLELPRSLPARATELLCRRLTFPETGEIDRLEPEIVIRTKPKANFGRPRSVVSVERRASVDR